MRLRLRTPGRTMTGGAPGNAALYLIGCLGLLAFGGVWPAGAADRGAVDCERCHGSREFLAGKGGDAAADAALLVSRSLLDGSRHESLACTDCHQGFQAAWPHGEGAVTVDCATCHQAVAEDWAASSHAAVGADGARCVSCHGAHRVLSSDQRESPTYPLNEPELCASCHTDPRLLATYFAEPADSTARGAARDYPETVHGRALADGGLIVSATCSDCHSPHRILPSDDPESSVFRWNVPETCGRCHTGIGEQYAAGVHGHALEAELAGFRTADRDAPVCTTCHSGHGVVSAEQSWRAKVTGSCAGCHEHAAETYLDSYHGKASTLGGEVAAKCSDCHGPHTNLRAADPASSVNRRNLVQTCGACHANATASFVQYDPHADHTDREGFPSLYWTWVAMSALLIGTFSFFGLHTLLWLVRSLAARSPVRKPAPPEDSA